jgi:type IV secretory pathway VirJ component
MQLTGLRRWVSYVASIMLAMIGPALAGSKPDILQLSQFGTVHIYHPDGPTRQVVLFLSGEAGWHDGVVGLAEQLGAQGALVAGIDTARYLRGIGKSPVSCAYPGADFERLSRLVQQHAGLTKYHYPILVGYSSGASLVYALLNQTATGTFAGGLSLGFCPQLALAKPLCKREKLSITAPSKGIGVKLLPAARMNDPWIVLRGEQDRACDADAVRTYTSGIQGATLVSLPRVGPDYRLDKTWSPQFFAAYQALSQAPQSAPPQPPSDLNDLPVLELPASGTQNDSFVVLLTGDGGYAGMDQQITAAFNAKGQPVAVLNALKYFWKARTPQEVANDVDRMMRYYSATWHKRRVILVGYSQGADVMPFVINRLPVASRATIAAAAAIAISDSALFEFHISNWLTDPQGVPTLPELGKLTGVPFVCIYGVEDDDSVCPKLDARLFRLVQLPGAHHFHGNYAAVAAAVLANAR